MGMELVTEMNGDLYPVSDCCNRTGDPTGGCIYTSSSYFESFISSSGEKVSIEVGDAFNHSYFNDIIPLINYKMIPKVTLHCTSTHDCQEMCADEEGTWDPETEICNIVSYLASVCYRVRFNESSFSLDDSDFVSASGTGCFASTDWSPYSYSPVVNSTLIPVHVPLLTVCLLDPTELRSCSFCISLYKRLFGRVSAELHLCCLLRSHSRRPDSHGTYLLYHLRCCFCCGDHCRSDVLLSAQVIVLYCMFWVGKKRNISPTRIMSPSYEKIFTPLIYAEFHPVELPDELAGLGMKGLHERLAVNGTLRVPRPSFSDSTAGPVEILDV